MKGIERYARAEYGMIRSAEGSWVSWDDVEKLLKQLPEGMEDCTIELKECTTCERNWLQPTNWVDHGCPHCEHARLQKEVHEMTARAFAAVWLLVQEGVPINEDFQKLHDNARSVLFGEDKKTIAKLQDKVARLQRALHDAERPAIPGVNVVYGVKPGSNVPLLLMLTSIKHGVNGGLEIEVQIP